MNHGSSSRKALQVGPGKVRSRPAAKRQGALRQKVRAAAHEAILEAAEQVFDERGLEAGMEAIAARAGVAVGTLYNHFADRRALVEALADARRATLVEKVEAVLQLPGAVGFEARLLAMLRVFSDVDARHARFRKALLETGVLHQPQRRRESRQKFEPLVRALFAQGVAEGVLPSAPWALHAAHLWGMWRSLFDLALEHPEVLALPDVAGLVVRGFLDGARRRGAP